MEKQKKTISSIIHDAYQELADIISGAYIDKEDNLKKYDRSKLSRAFGIFIAMIAASFIFGIVFGILLGPFGAKIFMTVVAPIIEEISKNVAIKAECTVEYTALFNIFEFTGFVIQGQSVIVRLIVVGMHITTTAIQKLMQSEWLHKKLGISPDDKEKKDKLDFIGHLIGILIHSGWNSGAVFSTKFQNLIGSL